VHVGLPVDGAGLPAVDIGMRSTRRQRLLLLVGIGGDAYVGVRRVDVERELIERPGVAGRVVQDVLLLG